MENLELSAKIADGFSVLNKLSNILSSGISIDDEDVQSIIKSLNFDELSERVNNIYPDYEYGIEDKDKLNFSSDYMYGIGETCLLLDPFDNYRVFTLYTEYDKEKTLDLSGEQKLYIVFRQGNKEIRIPEYTNYGSNISIDKEHGQVLFKIGRKNAIDILALKNRVFYITRIYETYDVSTTSYITSDEEVIFSGYWADRNSEKESKYLEIIKNLQETLNEREAAMQAMVDTINDLVDKNTKLSEENVKLSEAIETLIDKGIVKPGEDGGYDILPDDENDENMSNALRGEILDSRTLLIKDYNNLEEKDKQLIDNAVTIKEYEIDVTSDINDYVMS